MVLVLFPFVQELNSIRQGFVIYAAPKGHINRMAFGRFVLKMSEIHFQSLL